jgi:O-antigen/teichoic acid export membrane protein
MLVYTLLDPLKLTISNVFIAVGKPERIARTRAIQLLIMVIGLFTLGPWLGITGVALAVDVMILVGIGILLLEVRTYVDYSLRKLLLVPSLALIAGLVPARLSIEVLGYQGADWITGVSKASVFLVIYCTVLLLLEFRNLLMLVNFLRSVISRRQR